MRRGVTVSGQLRTLCSGAVVVAAIALTPGCEKQDPLTLREAEDWAYEWLCSIEHFLDTRLSEEADEEDEEDQDTADAYGAEDWYGPETLRDCFVDDNWQPVGFKNPTQAINWLTTASRSVGKVQSIDLVDGVSQVVFVLEGKGNPTVSATITLEDGFAKCSALTARAEQTKQGAG